MMPAQDKEVSRFTYVLAVVAGLFFMGAPFYIANLWANGPVDYERGVTLTFAAAYALLGGGFGFLSPEGGWRWGVWLSMAPLMLLSFLVPSLSNFLQWTGLTLLPACAGAYAGSRLHLKFTSVN